MPVGGQREVAGKLPGGCEICCSGAYWLGDPSDGFVRPGTAGIATSVAHGRTSSGVCAQRALLAMCRSMTQAGAVGNPFTGCTELSTHVKNRQT